jgi:hypothetical protein
MVYLVIKIVRFGDFRIPEGKINCVNSVNRANHVNLTNS